MDSINEILRKSSILTNHTLKSYRSAQSLPTLQSSVQYLPTPKKKARVMMIESKGKHQIMQEERVKGLIKLKTNLNKTRVVTPLPSIKKEDQIHNENAFVDNISNKLNSLMNLSEEDEGKQTNPEQKVDPDKNSFVEMCQNISNVSVIAEKSKNMRFKNKIMKMIQNMKCKELLIDLISSLENLSVNIQKLYRFYKKQFNRYDSIFRKELKQLSMQTKYMIENHQKNKYRYLNQDIDRIKNQMNRQGLKIGQRLSNIDNFNMRNGIFKSLKKMDFDCLANRNYYSQHTQRMAHINPNPI